MSSGFKIDPSSSSNLDYGRGNDDNTNNPDKGMNASSDEQKSYLDRKGNKKGADKSLDMRKARKKNKRKKKKTISERSTREFNEDQNSE